MNVTICFPWGAYFRHFLSNYTHEEVLSQIQDQFHNFTNLIISKGKKESNGKDLILQNVCGFVLYEDVNIRHCAWKQTRSIFGVVRKAYTMAGNISYQSHKVTFKGSNNIDMLKQILSQLLYGEFSLNLQLVVMSIGLNYCLETVVHCPLELNLMTFSWIRVMKRIEEICNVVIFYVTNWRAMEHELHMDPWPICPKSITISVTRRGTMTARLTFSNMEWKSTIQFKTFMHQMSKFIQKFI
jgi:hypothetical protein